MTDQRTVPTSRVNPRWATASPLALLAALLGLFGSLVLLGVPFAIAGLVLAHEAKKRIRNSGGTLRGMRMASVSLVLSYLALTISFCAAITAIALLVHVANKHIQPDWRREFWVTLWQGPESTFNTAMEACRAGNQAKAEALLAIGARIYPRDTELAFLDGLCARSRWERQRAYRRFRRVFVLSPNSIRATDLRSAIQIDYGRKIDANFAWFKQRTTVTHPDPLVLWLAAIECREDFRRRGKAQYAEFGVACYQRLLDDFQFGPVMVRHTYANILSMELGRNEDALIQQRIAVEREPTDLTFVGLANLLAKMNQYEEAGKAYGETVAVDPRDPEHWYNWGWCLNKQGRHAEAIEKLQKSIELGPRRGLTWGVWADALGKLRKPAEAVEKYKIGADLGDTFSMVRLGYCYTHGIGIAIDRNKAREWYQRAANRGDVQGMHELAALFEHGEADKEKSNAQALRWYQREAGAGATSASNDVARLKLQTDLERQRDATWNDPDQAVAMLGIDGTNAISGNGEPVEWSGTQQRDLPLILGSLDPSGVTDTARTGLALQSLRACSNLGLELNAVDVASTNFVLLGLRDGCYVKIDWPGMGRRSLEDSMVLQAKLERYVLIGAKHDPSNRIVFVEISGAGGCWMWPMIIDRFKPLVEQPGMAAPASENLVESP